MLKRTKTHLYTLNRTNRTSNKGKYNQRPQNTLKHTKKRIFFDAGQFNRFITLNLHDILVQYINYHKRNIFDRTPIFWYLVVSRSARSQAGCAGGISTTCSIVRAGAAYSPDQESEIHNTSDFSGTLAYHGSADTLKLAFTPCIPFGRTATPVVLHQAFLPFVCLLKTLSILLARLVIKLSIGLGLTTLPLTHYLYMIGCVDLSSGNRNRVQGILGG